MIPRSDSVGSGSGRKYLAPTLSDPAVRTEKERSGAKKRNNRPQGEYMCTCTCFTYSVYLSIGCVEMT